MNAPIEKTLNAVKCVGMETVVGAPDLTIEHDASKITYCSICAQHASFDFNVLE